MALYHVFKDGQRQEGKYAPPARQGESGAITLWRQRTGITEAEVPDSRLRAEIARPDGPGGPDPAEMRAREALHDVAARLAAPGEYNGADLGVELEKILLRHGWATKARRGKVVPVYPEGQSESEHRVTAIQRRMYLPGKEWDAYLGEHVERILGEQSSGSAAIGDQALAVVRALAEPLRGDPPVNAGDYMDEASRLLEGFEDAEPTGTERQQAAIRAARDLAVAVTSEEANDFLDTATRVLDRGGFLHERPAKYRCWVVLGKGKSRQIKSWGRDLKRDAIRSVKDAVREHRREGGVQGAEYEANWVWKRGRLEETVF